MPREIRAAVEMAEADQDVHVIVVRGAGPGFCGGYDLKHYAERKGAISGSQDMPWDPTLDFQMMWRKTPDFMALWRATKPTIARVHGAAVAGGSDKIGRAQVSTPVTPAPIVCRPLLETKNTPKHHHT